MKTIKVKLEDEKTGKELYSFTALLLGGIGDSVMRKAYADEFLRVLTKIAEEK